MRRFWSLRPCDEAATWWLFDSSNEAEVFLAAVRGAWGSPEAAPLLVSSPQARIVEAVETEEY